MVSAPARRDFEASKKLRTVMGEYFTELGRGPERGQEDGLVYQRGTGRTPADAGL